MYGAGVASFCEKRNQAPQHEIFVRVTSSKADVFDLAVPVIQGAIDPLGNGAYVLEVVLGLRYVVLRLTDEEVGLIPRLVDDPQVVYEQQVLYVVLEIRRGNSETPGNFLNSERFAIARDDDILCKQIAHI